MKKNRILRGIQSFTNYLLLMAKRWIIRIAAVVSILAALTAIFWPSLALPQIIYWYIAFVALFWSGYEVYRDTVQRIPLETAQVPCIPPRITIGPVEGNEYNFTLLQGTNEHQITLLRKAITKLQNRQKKEPENSGEHQKRIDKHNKTIDHLFPKDAVPDGQLELNVRVHNEDLDSVIVVSLEVSSSERFIDNIWYISFIHYIDSEGEEELRFPLDLSKNDLLLARARIRITPRPGLNRAQFASFLPEANRTSVTQFLITVQIRDRYGEIHAFSEECEVSFRPLRDLYLNRWRSRSEDELLDLTRKQTET